MITVVKEEDSPNGIANKVYTWCGKTRNRYPTKKIECLSVNPPKYKVTLNVEGEAAMVGSGEATSIQVAERAAVAALHKKLAPLMAKENTTIMHCRYGTFYLACALDEDRQRPWYPNVKAFVDSLAIMATQKPAKVIESCERDGQFYVGLEIELPDRCIDGHGVGSSKTEATKFAAIAIARQLDLYAIDVKVDEAKVAAFDKEHGFDDEYNEDEDEYESEYDSEEEYERNFYQYWMEQKYQDYLWESSSEEEKEEKEEVKKQPPSYWTTKPRSVVHQIFLDYVGKTPHYRYIQGQYEAYAVELYMYYQGYNYTGYGEGPNKETASFNAAYNFCQCWYQM